VGVKDGSVVGDGVTMGVGEEGVEIGVSVGD